MVSQTKGINNEKCKKKRAKNDRLLLYKNYPNFWLWLGAGGRGTETEGTEKVPIFKD